MSADDRPLVEELLDLLLYAPVGAALSAREELPRLVARGRRELEGRVGVARVVGKLAFGAARRRVEDALSSERAAPRAPAGEPARAARTETTGSPRSGTAPDEPVPEVGALAIPGYDSLAASQVVARLAGLRSDELDAVARYELANRHRRTILARIAQLRGDADDGR